MRGGEGSAGPPGPCCSPRPPRGRILLGDGTFLCLPGPSLGRCSPPQHPCKADLGVLLPSWRMHTLEHPQNVPLGSFYMGAPPNVGAPDPLCSPHHGSGDARGDAWGGAWGIAWGDAWNDAGGLLGEGCWSPASCPCPLHGCGSILPSEGRRRRAIWQARLLEFDFQINHKPG